MSLVSFNAIITATGQAISGTIDLPTARHPELPAVEDIQDEDIIALFDVSEGKTKGAAIDKLRSKLIGEGIPQTPVLNNGIIELTVDSVHVDNLRWDLPSISGQEFTLERRGIGMLQTTEYNILSTGGFILTGSSPVMKLGETFILTLTKLQGGDTEIIKNSNSFITGMVTVNDSIAWSDAHKGKLLNISGGSNKVTYTLPDISDADENLLIPIETNINNTYQSIIAAPAGQLIYFGGTSYNQMVMGFGDTLWLYNGGDGWYVVNAYGNYLTAGEPVFSYKLLPNTLRAQGQLVRKDEQPRLWAAVQSYGLALVTDVQWHELDANGLQFRAGCFALAPAGNNDEFRLPDLEGMFPRGLGGAAADGRAHNYPGGLQASQNKAHDHTITSVGQGDISQQGQPYLVLGTKHATTANHLVQATISSSGGTESRPINVGLYWLIRC